MCNFNYWVVCMPLWTLCNNETKWREGMAQWCLPPKWPGLFSILVPRIFSENSSFPSSSKTCVEDPHENQLRLIGLLSKYCNCIKCNAFASR